MADRPIFPDTLKTTAIDLDNADGTTLKDILTAGSDGTRISSIAVTSDDSSARQLDFYYHNGTSAFQIGTVTIPITAGTAASIPAVSALNSTDMPFLGEDLSFYLEGGKKLQVGAQVAVTAAKVVHIVVQHGDY